MCPCLGDTPVRRRDGHAAEGQTQRQLGKADSPPSGPGAVGEGEENGCPPLHTDLGGRSHSHSFPSSALLQSLHYANQVTTQICIIHALLVHVLVRLSDFKKQFCYL